MACEQELRLAAVKEHGATNLAGLTVHMLLADANQNCCQKAPAAAPSAVVCLQGLDCLCNATLAVFSTHLFTAPFLLNPALSVTRDQWNFSTSALHNVRMALHHTRKECHSGLP